MAMITKAQETEVCPYEKSHVIFKEKMQFHLAKCKYANNVRSLVECPFNSTHRVPKCELNYHKEYLCEDRKKVATFLSATENSEPLFDVVPYDVQYTENWADDSSTGYDPMTVIAERPILINLQGVTPSERKQFRMQESLRLQQISDGDAGFNKSCTVDQRRLNKPGNNKAVKIRTQQQDNEMTDVSTTSPLTPTTEHISDNTPSKFVDNDGFMVPRYGRRSRGKFVR